MVISVGSGIDIGPGINIGGTGTPVPVASNLTMWLNANDLMSYPGTGSTWFDVSDKVIYPSPTANITLVGSPDFENLGGGTPAYFDFNGSSQYGLGTVSVLDNTQYTKSLWMWLDAYADNNFSSSAAGGHFMYMGPGGATQKVYCGHTNWPDYTVFPSTTTFSLNTWYYIAVTFDTTNGMAFYVNGVLDATYTANKSAFVGDGSTNIATFSGGNLLNGRLSQTFFYDTALTGAQILQNFNATKATYGL